MASADCREFGYWFSDALNAQSWMAPASIIAIGLTW